MYYKYYNKRKSNNYIASLIQSNNFRTYVEVGVWKGDLFDYILKRCPNLVKMYGVDPYLSTAYNSKQGGTINTIQQETFEIIYNTIKSKFADYFKVHILRMTSKTAAKRFNDNSLDFVYIDADHSYEAVKNDIKLWYPKVKKGGILAGHDYISATPGVIKAVDECINGATIKYTVWWKKKG